MLVRDGTHTGEGQAGRRVSRRTEREGRGLAEVIENPILNSPYCAPTRHFYFDDDGLPSSALLHRASWANEEHEQRVQARRLRAVKVAVSSWYRCTSADAARAVTTSMVDASTVAVAGTNAQGVLPM